MDITDFMIDTYFNYSVKTNEQKQDVKVDESLIQYNSIYKSYEFYEAKFPEGFENISGFDKIIEKITLNSQNNTPLKEYTERIVRD